MKLTGSNAVVDARGRQHGGAGRFGAGPVRGGIAVRFVVQQECNNRAEVVRHV